LLCQQAAVQAGPAVALLRQLLPGLSGELFQQQLIFGQQVGGGRQSFVDGRVVAGQQWQQLMANAVA